MKNVCDKNPRTPTSNESFIKSMKFTPDASFIIIIIAEITNPIKANY
jgi:hypothetical protein